MAPASGYRATSFRVVPIIIFTLVTFLLPEQGVRVQPSHSHYGIAFSAAWVDTEATRPVGQNTLGEPQ
jgi:hypothetical protein